MVGNVCHRNVELMALSPSYRQWWARKHPLNLPQRIDWLVKIKYLSMRNINRATCLHANINLNNDNTNNNNNNKAFTSREKIMRLLCKESVWVWKREKGVTARISFRQIVWDELVSRATIEWHLLRSADGETTPPSLHYIYQSECCVPIPLVRLLVRSISLCAWKRETSAKSHSLSIPLPYRMYFTSPLEYVPWLVL